MIESRQLCIGYRTARQTHCVQAGLDFCLPSSRLVSLIGPNGSGKSTLLRTIGGLQPALSGELSIDGKAFASMSLAERARRLAMVLTDRISIEHCRVRDLVATARYPYQGRFKSLTQEDNELIDRAIEATHLENLATRSIDRLSDGERQRVMIAKALAQDTPVILLDEPTSHLDLPNRIEVMVLLRRLSEEFSKSILISTHEIETALQLSDTLWLLRPSSGGMLCGSPEELLSAGAIQREFAHPSFRINASGKLDFVLKEDGKA